MKEERRKQQDGTDLSGALRRVFGFERFRPNQDDIIQNVMAGRDVFAVMPTGGGKSLCYQLPAKLMKGTAVVVSPLISLMKDQVDAALENGISAAFINSSLSQGESASVYHSLREGELDLLYIAPERFAIPGFIDTLKSVNITFFAIDEAHCVSEWGHDFRPDYLSLSGIARTFSDIPIAAFTATATQRVQDDIIDRLGLRGPFTVRASFNRPNLFYRVRPKIDMQRELLDFLREHAGDAGIIYRTTRDSVTDMSDLLNRNGIKALPYHAGLSQKDRTENQEAFNRDEVAVIVATIAFGMGIDKSNVRFVVHADLPKNVEGYYQETGRAGRDGEPAECVLFFGREDIPKIRYFIDQMHDEREREIALNKMNQTVRYASHNVCRRKQLLEYFGEDYPEENCGTCDICTGVVEVIDIKIDAQKIMSAVSRTGQRFGAGHIVDIVAGANTKRIRELGHDKVKTYGVGSDKDKRHWRFIVDELLAQEALSQDGTKYPVLLLSDKGKRILFGDEQISALRREEPRKKKAAPKGFEIGPYDEVLFERLRGLRKRLADKQNVPPFVIFSDRTLHDMSRYYPTTHEDMSGVSGVGETKLEHYGDDFMKEIRAYLDEHPDIQVPERISFTTSAPSKPRKGKGKTVETTYELYREGLSREEIAEKRNLGVPTITLHLEQLITEGREVDLADFVEKEKQDEIGKLFLTLQSWQLYPIIDHFKGRVSYDEARLVRAYMRRKV